MKVASYPFFAVLAFCSVAQAGLSAVAAEVTCAERDQKFTALLRRAGSDSVTRLISERMEAEKPKLVIFGELHSSLSEATLYPQLTELVKSRFHATEQEPVCLFLEARSAESMLQNFNPKLLAAYRAQKLQLIPVDAPGEDDVDVRSEYMAKTMNQAFQTQKCAYGIQFVGKGHLEDIGTGNLQQFLQVPRLVVDLVSADYTVKVKSADPMAAMLRSFSDGKDIVWRQCPASQNIDLKTILSPIAISTREINDVPITANRRMLDRFKNGPFWSTYDLLVVSVPKP